MLMSIRLENINYIYSPDSAFKKQALKNVSLEIKDGEFIGLIGHTGSGKSTLIQHLNGLIKATSGHIYYNDQDIYDDKFNLRGLRALVGLVFQYPEHQLFEVTVFKDVCFGPKNLGLSQEECEARAREALEMVGLKEKHWQKSPFELSGGQKRRAAIAGVLAMHPEVLILDEPTAGLDPKGRNDIFGSGGKAPQRERYDRHPCFPQHGRRCPVCGPAYCYEPGKRLCPGNSGRWCFRHYVELERIGLAAPQVTYVMHRPGSGRLFGGQGRDNSTGCCKRNTGRA